MKIIKTLSLCVLAGLAVCVPSRADGWRGIVPLHSTRADVERLLGTPSNDRCKCYYDLGDVGVSVLYAEGPCEKGKPGRWNVPRDTVISMSVYFEKKPLLSDLHLDVTKFDKTENLELPGYVTYSNREEGVTYEVTEKGIVQGINYYPAAKDKHLRCSEAASKRPCGKNSSK